MINALIGIGNNLKDLYPMPLVQIPYPYQTGKKEPKIFVIDLISNQDLSLKLEQIDLMDYSIEDSYKRYFFRSPSSSHGAAASLSFKLSEKTQALRERLKILIILGYKIKQKKLEQIAELIGAKYKEFKDKGLIAKNTPILLVFRIDKKWPSENKRLKELFVENFLLSISKYKNKLVWKRDGKCHGCGLKTTIYGGVGNLFKAYTVDKYGYAPGLNPKDSWKQYALCENCILNFERGNRAVDEFLTYSFYGKSFWLLPVSTGELKDVLEIFRFFHKEISGKIKADRDKGDSYLSHEDELLERAGAQEDVLFYHFVFTKKDNQAVRILLHIEEVLPSVLRRYVERKREMEKRFNDIISETSLHNNSFHFSFFFSKNLKESKQRPGFNDKNFFNLVDKVFRRSPINETYLISKVMRRIRADMAEMQERETIPWWTVLESLVSLEFLLEWGVLKRKDGGIIMDNSAYQEFFERHGNFFNHPAKRGLVLLGVLTQNFLNYQFQERGGSTPFLKNLKNLRLDQRDIQSIFVALQNKMNEYGIGHWWKNLREGISLSFIEAGERWPFSPDEIGFYMAIGMSLNSHTAFKDVKDADKDKE